DERIQFADSQSDQHTTNSGQHGAGHEGEGDDLVGIDAQQIGHAQVLRAGTGSAAKARMLDIQMEHDHQNNCDENDHDAGIRGGDDIAADIELRGPRYKRRNGLVACSLTDRHPVLQENGHADGGNEGDKAGPTAQRCVSDFFYGKAIDCCDQYGHDQHEKNDQGDWQAATHTYGRERDQPDISANHVNFAMSEVDHPDDAIDHCVANGNQRINGAERQPFKELLQ